MFSLSGFFSRRLASLARCFDRTLDRVASFWGSFEEKDTRFSFPIFRQTFSAARRVKRHRHESLRARLDVVFVVVVVRELFFDSSNEEEIFFFFQSS